MKELLPAKKYVFAALLLRGTVFIHLDPRKPGVVVPQRLKMQAQVVLQVGLDMPVPIPDLHRDNEKVSGTLSFKGVPFTCTIPWSAVFALVGDDAKGMVWKSELPPEIVKEVEKNEEQAKAQPLPEGVVRLDPSRASKTPSRVPARPKSDRPACDRPSWLRVVK